MFLRLSSIRYSKECPRGGKYLWDAYRHLANLPLGLWFCHFFFLPAKKGGVAWDISQQSRPEHPVPADLRFLRPLLSGPRAVVLDAAASRVRHAPGSDKAD